MDTSPAAPESGRAADLSHELRRFARLARHLAEQSDRTTAGQAIAEGAVGVLNCTAAAVALVDRRNGITFQIPGGGEDGVVPRIAEIVRRIGEGPAIEAVTTGEVALADDLTAERRWTRYAELVTAETPVRSVLVHPLRLGDDTMGVLALYDSHPGFFDQDRQDLAQVYADHASIALARVTAADQAAHLEIAVASNRTIGQAVGILMTRYRVTSVDAFDILRLASQASNHKVRTIADDVVREGDLPAYLDRLVRQQPAPDG